MPTAPPENAPSAHRLSVIIPALDEEESIAGTVGGLTDALQAQGLPFEIIVANNGSTDATAEVARRAGAVVVDAPIRGYGAACLAGIDALRDDCTIVLFADGDGADDPQDLAALLKPLLRGQKDMTIGSRAMGAHLNLNEPGALTAPQRFGNRLSCTLIRLFFGVGYTDLGPFRAITRDALDRLRMDDENFGWTVQMQARAARLGLRVADVPVHYRRRVAGQSKVSGNVKGSVLAGTIILRTVGREAKDALVETVSGRKQLPRTNRTPSH